MSLPPQNTPSDQLWAMIMQLPRPFRLVDFPRQDPVTGKPIGQIAIQVLSQEEQMICAAAAEKFAREKLKDSMPRADDAQLGYDALYKNAASVELLYRACVKPEDVSKKFFPSPKLLTEKLSPDEVGVLVMHYFTVQAEMGPIVSQMSEEENDAWNKRLAEGGSRLPLDLLSLDAVRNLAFISGCRLHNYLMATSSAGSPQDATTSAA